MYERLDGRTIVVATLDLTIGYFFFFFWSDSILRSLTFEWKMKDFHGKRCTFQRNIIKFVAKPGDVKSNGYLCTVTTTFSFLEK